MNPDERVRDWHISIHIEAGTVAEVDALTEAVRAYAAAKITAGAVHIRSENMHPFSLEPMPEWEWELLHGEVDPGV